MTTGSIRPANWSQMTHEQKREWRFQNWIASADNINFVNTNAEQSYRTRVKRLYDVYNVREPDRVPVSIRAGVVPLYSNGIDYHTALYDTDKAHQAFSKFNAEHAAELESYFGFTSIPARLFDILDYRLYAYPGHGMPESAPAFQFVESEYMKAGEYEDLITDPSDFWLRTYLPRVFGAFGPFRQFGRLTDIVEIVNVHFGALASPDMITTLQKLIEAGNEIARSNEIAAKYEGEAEAYGYPSVWGTGFAKAPFDTLGDTLRGTNGIMMDMYRHPDKVLKALDVIADITIKSVLTSPSARNGLIATFPLHKGADGWMSQKQFLTFYWPSLRKVINAFINEGIIVSLFAEGSYNTRLELVNEFSKGAVHWMFDQTDMARAKKVLGSQCSIEGNVPSSLLVTGTPEDVKEYCRKLIEVCGPGGGYQLSPGALPDFPKIENLKAMVDAAKEYGVYHK